MRLNSTITLTVDVAEWLRRSGKFDHVRSTDRGWISATCPFHNDVHPSFAVNEDSGAYRCLACGASGNFVQLVQYVERHDTLYDAEQSLIARFGRFVPDTTEPLVLDYGDPPEPETFLDALPDDYVDHSDWLAEQRGIDADTQARFDVGYASMRDAVAIPWHDEKGRIVVVKYRRAGEKMFWYEPRIVDGRLKRMLFGYYAAKDAPMIVVCEGEIDAMSVAQAGFAAVALGGAHLSREQALLLRDSAADEIVVMTDNDEAGRKAASKITDALVGHKRVSNVDWSPANDCKDANDVLRLHGAERITMLIDMRTLVGPTLTFD